MHKILILTVGKLKETQWQEAQREYSLRSAPFSKLEVVEVAPEPITGTVDAARSMKEEGARLLARLKEGDAVIALDRLGKSLASEELAAAMAELGDGGRRLVFIVGGAAGLDRTVLDRTERRVSLSKMTFTHEMARIILLEQIYRAETILAGKKYHY